MKLTEWFPCLALNCHSHLVKLRIRDAVDDPRTCEIERLPVVVGRGEEADIRLTDQWVSKAHCRLTVVGGVLVVRDLESRNGTAVNRDLVAEQQLQVGDTISIGASEIQVIHIANRKRLQQTGAESSA